MFINFKLKLYKNICIVSLPCYLFVFVSLLVMFILYTGHMRLQVTEFLSEQLRM